MGEEKIKTLEELEAIVKILKNQNKKIVHCHGNFDLVHYGHIRHFLCARKQGDVLIVTITPDRFIQKGPGRPFFNEDIRLKHLSCIECIDYVALNNWPTAIETIKMIKPDVFVKGKEVLNNKNVDEINTGSERLSNLCLEEQAVQSINGRLYLTDEITFSSSKIINQITDAIPDESKRYLAEIKKLYNSEKIIEILESLKNIKPLIIGDAILDEYVFCKEMEKSGKEILVPHKFMSSEIYLGGVFAVANHTAGFTDNLALVTCIGENHHEPIHTNLNPKIDKNIFIQNNSKTIIKRRYLNQYRNSKLFQVYNTDELEIERETQEKILSYLDKNLSKFDLVVVSDFGHGMMFPGLIEYLTNCRQFLAVNCQLNAGNLGYNFITKYKRTDFVSLQERELRLPLQERKSDIKVPIAKLSNVLNLNKINITSGKFGSTYYENGDYFYSPVFVTEPIDNIGAGDAAFSLASLLVYKKVDPRIIPFLVNVMGGLATRTIGNKRPVDPIELKKFVTYIMK